MNLRNAMKKEKKLKKWKTKQEEKLYTQSNTQQQDHTKWQKYVSTIQTILISSHSFHLLSLLVL